MLRNALQPWHLLIVVLVMVVLFGSKKLPDSARALGKSLRILKSEAKAMKDEDAPHSASTEQPGYESGPESGERENPRLSRGGSEGGGAGAGGG
ncbi:Sec-independent protein translocase subunit TatA [Streptomyces sp. TP-A0874]|uniref:Sec-independent protein translocase subunit TatA n=1 Tax=Streptomyces sp. TP-A0874 TaxID=549819 RepID=UPI000852E6FE|nr:Sec-independent protein translocase subunit TatA [Streptomyces sp. TP-A0874]